MSKNNKFSFLKRINLKNKDILVSFLAVLFILIPVISFVFNGNDKPHKAELRFSEKSSVSGVLGSVIPASCDSNNVYNGDGNFSGCWCANGAGDYPTCTPAPVCGSNNNNSFSSAPSGDCSVGTPSGVSGSGPWTWVCYTYRPAYTTVDCAAYPKPICGIATSKNYKESESYSMSAGDRCQTGSAGALSYTRNAQGKATSVSWSCTSGYPNGVTNCSTAIVDPALAVTVTASGAPRTCGENELWNGSTCVITSGTLTSSASSCEIVAGQSSCNVALTWDTSNNTYTSRVVSTSISSPLYISNLDTNRSVSVANTGQTFYLYNNNKILKSISVGATCIYGTTWNGSSCVYSSGVITPSASSCYIPAGASSCNVTFDWYTDYPVGTSAITSDGVTIYTANSGTNRPITLGFTNLLNKTYYLYNNARLLHQISLKSSCVPGSTWNGSVCVLPAGSISASGSSNCTISTNARTCSLPISWNTINPIDVSSVVTASDNSVVVSSNSGTYNVLIGKSGETYYLRNNGINISSVSLTANCQTGSTWNGTYCRKN